MVERKRNIAAKCGYNREQLVTNNEDEILDYNDQYVHFATFKFQKFACSSKAHSGMSRNSLRMTRFHKYKLSISISLSGLTQHWIYAFIAKKLYNINSKKCYVRPGMSIVC